MTKKQKEMVDNTYKCNSFYRELAQRENVYVNSGKIEKEWEKLPVVTKAMLLNAEECFISDSYISWLYENRLLKTYTSGSTGDILEVYWKLEDYNESLFPLWVYRLQEHRISPSDKLCYFYTTRQAKGEEWFEEGDNRLGFCKAALSKERMKQIYKKMLEFSPKWLLLQPSIAKLLAAAKNENGYAKCPDLHYIELTGEMVTKQEKLELEKQFGCRIVNQYGSNEVNSIAYECENGHLHILENNVYVEVLDENNKPVLEKEGEICVTSWKNRAMPFIRFKIGDRGIIRKQQPVCRIPGRILELTKARSNDWIITDKNRKITPYALLKVIENMNEELDDSIIQFRFLQKSKTKILVKLVLDDEFDRGHLEKMFMDFIVLEELKNFLYEFEYYDFIELDPVCEKFAWFESEVKV